MRYVWNVKKNHNLDHSYSYQSSENNKLANTLTELIHHENRFSSPYSHQKSQIILQDTFKIYSRKDTLFYKCTLKLTRSCLILSLNRRIFVDNLHTRKYPIKNDDDSFIEDDSTIEESISISLNHITNAYRTEKLLMKSSYQHVDDIANVLQEKATLPTALIDYDEIQLSRIDKSKSKQSSISEIAVPTSSPSQATSGCFLYISVYRTPAFGSNSIKLINDDQIIKSTPSDNYQSTTLTDSDARDVYIFHIDKLRMRDFNVTLADKWVGYILALIQQKPMTHQHIKIDYTLSKMQGGKRLLIMVNFGDHGRGNSFKIFKDRILPILLDSQIEFDVFNTNKSATDSANDRKQSMDAWDNVKHFLIQESIKPVKWRGFVIIADDVLLHHVINSLMNRKDWPLAISVPLAIVPDLKAIKLVAHDESMAQLAAKSTTNKLVEISTRNVLRSYSNDFDLLKISFNNQSVVWCHLSISWAFPVSENQQQQLIFKRSTNLLSMAKSIIWSWHRGVTMPSYKGKLSYKKAPANKHQSKDQPPSQNSDDEIISHQHRSTEKRKDLEWIVVEGKFFGILATNLSYLSHDVRTASSSRYAVSSDSKTTTDKYISLIYIIEENSSSFLRRVNLCRACTAKGKLSETPYVKEVLVSQLKLEPLDNESDVFVDGEKSNWKSGPIDVEIIPGIARIYCDRD